MKVNRIGDVAAYSPPNHHDMAALRLQGWDASDSQNFWVGLSHILPGGGADHEATPLEKVYVVVSGLVTVVTDDGESTLGPLDSCYIAANEARSVVNRTNGVASMVVVMPYPTGTVR
jgi:mannose-6-phosphate isomerase-like protein (cupin superfamily)